MIFGTDEHGIHFNDRLPRPDEPIEYVSYSPAGFPMGGQLDELTRKLDAKHPGAMAELQTAVGQVASGQARTGNDLTLSFFPTQADRAHLGDAVFDLIHREFEDLPPNPQDPSTLSRRFPEIHELAAVLIRQMVCELQAG